MGAAIAFLVCLAQPADEDAPIVSKVLASPIFSTFDKLAADAQWKDLARAIEMSRERYAGTLVVRDGVHRGFGRALNDFVDTLPKAGQDAIRAAIEPQAQTLFMRWGQTQDEAALREIAAVYPESAWTALALEKTGNLAADRGDLAGAAAAWSRALREASNDRISRPAVALKLAIAWSMLGRRHEIPRLVADAGALGLKGRVILGRDEVDVVERLERLAVTPLPMIPDPVAPRALAIGPSTVVRQMTLTKPVNLEMILNGSRPAVAGESIYLALPDRVVAIRMADEPFVEWNIEEGTVPSGQTFLPLSAAISGDLVVATRCFRTPGPGRLCAFRRINGDLVWEAKESEFTKETDSFVTLSAPVVAGERILVAVNESKGAGSDSARVVALDAATGRVVWDRVIGGASTAGVLAWSDTRGDNPTVGAPPTASLHEGRLFVGTNLGMVACIEPATGDVVWVGTYARKLGYPDRAARQSDREQMKPLGFPRAAAAPVFANGEVFHLPLDAESIVGFDRSSGKPGGLLVKLATQLDVWDGRLIAAVGESIVEIDPATRTKRDLLTVGDETLRMTIGDGLLCLVNGARVPVLTRFDLRAACVLESTPVEAFDLDSALMPYDGRIVLAGSRISICERAEVYKQAERVSTLGGPLAPEVQDALASTLFEAGEIRRAMQLTAPRPATASGDSDLLLARATSRMREPGTPEQKARWARSVVVRTPHAALRLEALEVLATALLAEGKDEDALEVAAMGLAQTAAGPNGAEDAARRSGVRMVAARVQRRNETVARTFAAKAEQAGRSLADADVETLLRHARFYPYTPSALDALQRAAKQVASAAECERIIKAFCEVGPTLTKESRVRLAEALESGLKGVTAVAEPHERAAKLVETLRQ